jgi:hypothetical protein
MAVGLVRCCAGSSANRDEGDPSAAAVRSTLATSGRIRAAWGVLGVVALVTGGCSSGAGARVASDHAGLGGRLGRELVAVQRFGEYPIYWLGPTYGKLRLTGISIERVNVVNRTHTKILRTHSHSVLFTYGTCSTPPDGESCAPPLDVQNWPACGRSPTVYHLRLPFPDDVRGAPAAGFGDREEIWTGTSDVVIFFSHSRRAVADSLRSANHVTHVKPGQKLPPAAPAPLSGKLRCKP